jgi:hypothetical protein
VQRVSRLISEDSASDLYRMCVAYLAHEADPKPVIERLQQLPQIEEAEAPAPRTLIQKG